MSNPLFIVIWQYKSGSDLRSAGVFSTRQKAAEALVKVAATRDLDLRKDSLSGTPNTHPVFGTQVYNGADAEGNAFRATFDVTGTDLIAFTTDYGFRGQIESHHLDGSQ
jgi:hypothetical protein